MSNTKENIIVYHIENFLSLTGQYRGALMGVAIIWVMMLHGSELYSDVSIPIITSLAERGNIGVDIFLFLSGFGLYFSFDKNNDLYRFYSRRLQRVVVPYLIISAPFWVYNTIHLGAGVRKFLADYIGISFVTDGVVTTWYVFLIVGLYIAFPLIYYLEQNRGGGIG